MHALKYVKFITATAIYVAFALYLYQPHFAKFNTLQYLLPVNSCFAALGCFVLSRRWVSAYAASFFTGAIYGFGPFILGSAKFHPAAGLLAAAIPWLFCPAAFIIRTKLRMMRWPLVTLPFLTIVLLFNVSAHYRLFIIPIQEKLGWGSLVGLIAPLVMAQRGMILFGFYHASMPALLMGLILLFTARRFGIIVMFCIGTALASCNSIFHVSPIIWLSIPALLCSVLIGVGMQALAWSGHHDSKWILLAIALSGTVTVVTLFLAFGKGVDEPFITSAKMYLLGTITAAVIYFLARAELCLTLFRWIMLYSTMAIDIFLSAQFIVDKVL